MSILRTHHIRTRIQLSVLQRTLGSLSLEELDAIKILMRQLQMTQYGNITKRELCRLYDFSPKVLRKRMAQAQGLTEELIERFHYNKKRKNLTPAEAETIMRYLGEPLKLF